MAKRLTVVVSQGQSANPAKRKLEEDIVATLIMEPGIEVTVVPHLYDLKGDGTGMLALQGVSGDMVILSWLFERAALWTLDRHGVRGKPGRVLLKGADSEEEADEDSDSADPEAAGAEADAGAREDDGKQRVAEQRTVPNRRIYCLDLRAATQAGPFVEEVRRIADECRQQLVSLGGWLTGQPTPTQLQRFQAPTNQTALPIVPTPPGDRSAKGSDGATMSPFTSSAPRRIDEDLDRRWYPVIDFSRCTNCMECIDFCLFGVYGVDRTETIVVEQPDNCRKGCPACSRVCPENAIIFPQHKTPAIAGAPVGLVSLKIDLSKLFGAPDEGKSAAEIAALERDEQLIIAGREAVGMSVGIPKRQAAAPNQPQSPKDDLDSLLDELDEANL